MVVARCDIGGQRPEGVERGFAAFQQLLVHVLLDLVHRHMPGPSIITWQPFFHAIWVSFAQGFEFGELRAVVRIGNRARRRPSPSENETSYFRMISQISSKRS